MVRMSTVMTLHETSKVLQIYANIVYIKYIYALELLASFLCSFLEVIYRECSFEKCWGGGI